MKCAPDADASDAMTHILNGNENERLRIEVVADPVLAPEGAHRKQEADGRGFSFSDPLAHHAEKRTRRPHDLGGRDPQVERAVASDDTHEWAPRLGIGGSALQRPDNTMEDGHDPDIGSRVRLLKHAGSAWHPEA